MKQANSEKEPTSTVACSEASAPSSSFTTPHSSSHTLTPDGLFSYSFVHFCGEREKRQRQRGRDERAGEGDWIDIGSRLFPRASAQFILFLSLTIGSSELLLVCQLVNRDCEPDVLFSINLPRLFPGYNPQPHTDIKVSQHGQARTLDSLRALAFISLSERLERDTESPSSSSSSSSSSVGACGSSGVMDDITQQGRSRRYYHVAGISMEPLGPSSAHRFGLLPDPSLLKGPAKWRNRVTVQTLGKHFAQAPVLHHFISSPAASPPSLALF
ncbi:unnamed protein product [Pleuronectes platessa]|uniref:Uncharacterized protein n=1 Tax=Pleuronectes platessa TaxID=8262 RepID=A0A9N7UFK6_PLEPL|nr:unnamed protein product [Pleuronectes platessa]